MFGNPETTTGGLALKFYSSVRLDIRKIENIKQGDMVTGAKIRVKIVKNKVAPPYRMAEFEMVNGVGISREGCILDMGVETGIIEKAGSWFEYKGERIGQGRDNAKNYLKEHIEIMNNIEKELKSKYLNETLSDVLKKEDEKQKETKEEKKSKK
jgi:recombination protein RecA